MAKKKRKSNFRNSVASDTERQKTESGANYGYLKLPKGISVFSPDPGSRVLFDILPYEVTSKAHPDRNTDPDNPVAIPGELWYKRPFKIHRNVGAGDDSVVCLSSFGKKCPICEEGAKRKRAGADKDELKSYRPSSRNLYYVKPLDTKKYDEEWYLMDISTYCFQELLSEELREDEDRLVFPSLEEGLTLKVRFDKESFAGNAFAKASRIDFKERDDVYEEEVLDEFVDLDDILSEISYDELSEMFFFEEGGEGEEDSQEENQDEDEMTAPPRRRKKADKEEEEEDEPKTKRRRKKEPEPEPEEDEDDCVACGGTGTNSKGRECRICKGTGIKPKKEEDEDSEPEEKPKRRKREKKEESNPCPYGHKFGVDVDQEEECKKCDEWDDCMDKKEENEED
jgi:hypothetical protein